MTDDERKLSRATLLRAESHFRLAREVSREARERIDSLVMGPFPGENEILRAIAAVRVSGYKVEDVKLVLDIVQDYMQKKVAGHTT